MSADEVEHREALAALATIARECGETPGSPPTVVAHVRRMLEDQCDLWMQRELLNGEIEATHVVLDRAAVERTASNEEGEELRLRIRVGILVDEVKDLRGDRERRADADAEALAAIAVACGERANVEPGRVVEFVRRVVVERDQLRAERGKLAGVDVESVERRREAAEAEVEQLRAELAEERADRREGMATEIERNALRREVEALHAVERRRAVEIAELRKRHDAFEEEDDIRWIARLGMMVDRAKATSRDLHKLMDDAGIPKAYPVCFGRGTVNGGDGITLTERVRTLAQWWGVYGGVSKALAAVERVLDESGIGRTSPAESAEARTRRLVEVKENAVGTLELMERDRSGREAVTELHGVRLVDVDAACRVLEQGGEVLGVSAVPLASEGVVATTEPGRDGVQLSPAAMEDLQRNPRTPCPEDQPLPKGGEGDAWAELLDVLDTYGLGSLRWACEERRALGLRRYGATLGRGDGRDGTKDLRDELLDGAGYGQREHGGPRAPWIGSLELLRAARDPLGWATEIAILRMEAHNRAAFGAMVPTWERGIWRSVVDALSTLDPALAAVVEAMTSPREDG